jgi:signal transduction protein with GAF and PtsI domain
VLEGIAMVSATAGGGARVILRKLREIMAQGESAQERLNALVRMIAATVVQWIGSMDTTSAVSGSVMMVAGLEFTSTTR